MPHAIFTAELDRRSLTKPIIIGRGSECDIVIPDGLISRRHCRLSPTADGWVLTDLENSNGTHVRGERVARHLLKDGDVIRLGRIHVCFYAGELTAGPAHPPAAHGSPAHHPHIATHAPHGEDEVSTGLGELGRLFTDQIRLEDSLPGLPAARHAPVAAVASVTALHDEVQSTTTAPIAISATDAAPVDQHAERERMWSEIEQVKVKSAKHQSENTEPLGRLPKTVFALIAIGTALIIFGLSMALSSWVIDG